MGGGGEFESELKQFGSGLKQFRHGLKEFVSGSGSKNLLARIHTKTEFSKKTLNKGSLRNSLPELIVMISLTL